MSCAGAACQIAAGEESGMQIGMRMHHSLLWHHVGQWSILSVFVSEDPFIESSDLGQD
jgi:hypothetical protein